MLPISQRRLTPKRWNAHLYKKKLHRSRRSYGIIRIRSISDWRKPKVTPQSVLKYTPNSYRVLYENFWIVFEYNNKSIIRKTLVISNIDCDKSYHLFIGESYLLMLIWLHRVSRFCLTTLGIHNTPLVSQLILLTKVTFLRQRTSRSSPNNEEYITATFGIHICAYYGLISFLCTNGTL